MTANCWVGEPDLGAVDPIGAVDDGTQREPLGKEEVRPFGFADGIGHGDGLAARRCLDEHRRILLDRRALPGTEAERGLGVGGGANFDGALDKMDDRPPPRQIDLEDRPKRGGFTSRGFRSEESTSELQSLMRKSYTD